MKIKNISGLADNSFVTLFELTLLQYDKNYGILTIFCITIFDFDIGFGLHLNQ